MTTSGLEQGEVHVMTADVDPAPEQLEELAALLSDEERARAERFRFPRDRDRYVGSQAFLRVALSEYLGIEPESVRFGTRQDGKPVLAGELSDIRFNLAHSGGRAAYTFALGREVGIDIEEVVPRDDLEGLASRFFAPEELAVLDAMKGAEWLEAFYNCWTRKEAVLKAVGHGLRIPLDQFVVAIRSENDVRVVKADSGISELLDLDLRVIDVGPSFIGAVAFEAGAVLVEVDSDLRRAPRA